MTILMMMMTKKSTKNQPTTTPPHPPKVQGTSGTSDSQFKKFMFLTFEALLGPYWGPIGALLGLLRGL
jgi:hypothetical protein